MVSKLEKLNALKAVFTISNASFAFAESVKEVFPSLVNPKFDVMKVLHKHCLEEINKGEKADMERIDLLLQRMETTAGQPLPKFKKGGI